MYWPAVQCWAAGPLTRTAAGPAATVGSRAKRPAALQTTTDDADRQ